MQTLARVRVWIAVSALVAVAAPQRALANDFPGPGSDAFESTMTVLLTVDALKIVELPIDVTGPTAIMRGAPDGDPCTIDTEIVALDLRATGTPIGDVRVHINEMESSTGKITSLGEGCTFPADSFFDVFVRVEVDGLGVDLVNREPVQVVNQNLQVIPPFFDTYLHPPPKIDLFPADDPGSDPVASIAGGSSHRVEQLPTFSVDASGPSGLDAADLHDAGGPPPPVGLTRTGLGLAAADNIDALSYGLDTFGALEDYESQPMIAFSVDPNALGRPNTGVNREATRVTGAEAEGDEFVSYYDNNNIELVDEQALVLQPGPPGDDLNALTNQPTSYADLDQDTDAEQPVFFSLAPGSPTLGGLSATEGAILSSRDGVVSVYALASDIGLIAGDDLDALCLMKAGLPDATLRPGSVAAAPPGPGAARFDYALFSLAPGSPTLATLGASPGDILVTNFSPARPGLQAPPAVYAPASRIGLLDTDDLDALKCLLEVAVFDIWGHPDEDGFWLVDFGGTDSLAAHDAEYDPQLYNIWSIENPGVDFHGPYVHPSSPVAKQVPFEALDPAQVAFVGGPGDNCGFPHVHGGEFEGHPDPDNPACGHGVFVPHVGPELPIFQCNDLHLVAGDLVGAMEAEAPPGPSFSASYHVLSVHPPPPYEFLTESADASRGVAATGPGMAMIVIGRGKTSMEVDVAGAGGLIVSGVRSSLPVPLVVPEPAGALGGVFALSLLAVLRRRRSR